MPTQDAALDPTLAGHALEPLDADRQRAIRVALGVLGVLGTASLVGVAFSLYLVNHAPVLLIAMSPLGRHLVLVAPVLPPAVFVGVLVVRRLAFYQACFHLGGALGPRGIVWLEARAARFAGFVRWLERLFARAPRTVVFAMSGPTVSALAGVSGMRARVFVPLATASLTLRALVVLGFAEWIRSYVLVARVWIDEYWVPGTVVMVTGVAIHVWWRRRRG